MNLDMNLRTEVVDTEIVDTSGFVASLPASETTGTPVTGYMPPELQGVDHEKRERIKSALDALPVEFYDERQNWIKVGIALKNEGEAYFELFDAFSSPGKKYEGRDDCRRAWDSFKEEYEGKRITVGSLFHHARENGWQESTHSEASPEERYPSMSLSQLFEEDFQVDYLIEGFLIEGQSCIIGGPQKSLKTTILLNAALQLALGGMFLGKFKCEKRRVLVMTGESGLAAIKQSLQAMLKGCGDELPEKGYFEITEDLPKFAKESDIETLRLKIQELKTQVLFIDPAYLSMGGAEAGNLQSQGELLRAIGDMCRQESVTLVLAHHVTKAAGKGKKALELSDLTWAGYAEWTRQWWILNRRSNYAPGSGLHELWMNVGNSSRHSALWSVDINEGTKDEPGWEVSLETAEECKGNLAAKKGESKRQADTESVLAFLGTEEFVGGAAKTTISEEANIHKTKVDGVLEVMLEDRLINQIPGPRRGTYHYVLNTES